MKLLDGMSKMSHSQVSVCSMWWSTFAASVGGPSIIVWAAVAMISLNDISKKISKLFWRWTSWL